MNLRQLGVHIRTNKTIYSIYYYSFSSFFKLLKLFIPCNPKRILFVSFGGLKYDDSPKEIYMSMLKDRRFNNFEFIWAFISPSKFNIPKGKIIKIDSLKYFYYAISSKIWITNSSVERGLSLKRLRTIYFNTWHGTPIKKMGSDLADENESFTSKACSSWNVQLAQSQYEADIFSRVFGLSKDKFKVIGLPRNDSLAHISEYDVMQVRKRLNLPEGKRIILYAPTFREYAKDENNNSIFEIPINLKLWEKELGQDYILLIRAHYDIVRSLNIPTTEFVKDFSSYNNLNDLMIASDILISDYSSIFFDYSILGRPMLCYACDYDEYQQKRGLYFDIRSELAVNNNLSENDLINEIKCLDYDFRKQVAINFRTKFVTEYGDATDKSLDIIHDLITQSHVN